MLTESSLFSVSSLKKRVNIHVYVSRKKKRLLDWLDLISPYVWKKLARKKKANSRWPFNMCCNEKDMKALWKLGKLLHELIHTLLIWQKRVGVSSVTVHCLLRACTVLWKARLATYVKKEKVSMCRGVLWRSWEIREMIINKGRNPLPGGCTPKPPNNKYSTALTNALSMLVAMVIVSSTL